MNRILTYLKPYRWRMLIGFLIKVAGTMAELVLPMILTYILEQVIATMHVPQVIRYGVIMLVFSIVACVGNVIANRMAARVTTDFSKAMRSDLFRKTLYLSSADTDAFTIPSLESRITTDTYNVHNFIGMIQRLGVRAPILLIGGTILTFIMDPALALVMLATTPFIFMTVYGISRKGVPLYTDVQRASDSMIRVAREDISGIRVIKALSKNDHENKRYDTVNAALSAKERRAGTVMSIVNPDESRHRGGGDRGGIPRGKRTVIRRHRHCVHAIFHVDLHGDDVAVAHVCDVHQMRRFGKPHRTGA